MLFQKSKHILIAWNRTNLKFMSRFGGSGEHDEIGLMGRRFLWNVSPISSQKPWYLMFTSSDDSCRYAYDQFSKNGTKSNFHTWSKLPDGSSLLPPVSLFHG
ncbi:hypothetical protein LXL04_009746 [Taraxacum kok-saghyz]